MYAIQVDIIASVSLQCPQAHSVELIASAMESVTNTLTYLYRYRYANERCVYAYAI